MCAVIGKISVTTNLFSLTTYTSCKARTAFFNQRLKVLSVTRIEKWLQAFNGILGQNHKFERNRGGNTSIL